VTTLRLDDCTPGMFAKLTAHLPQVADWTPPDRLADPATGEAVTLPVCTAMVPSHDSRPGWWWEIRVSWHRGKVNAWHVPQLDEQTGEPAVCLAYATSGRCWHLYAAAVALADTYGLPLPEPARRAPAPSPARARRRPPRPAPVPERVPWPPLATAGYYD
jgi:hypothetical protein